MLLLQLSNLAGFHTPLLTVTLNMPFTIWRTSIERAAWVKSSHYHLTAAAQSPQLFEAYMWILCSTCANPHPRKALWSLNLQRKLGSLHLVLVYPSHRRNCLRQLTLTPSGTCTKKRLGLSTMTVIILHHWSSRDQDQGLRLTAEAYLACCTYLDCFGRGTQRRIVVETNRYVAEHIQVRIPENSMHVPEVVIEQCH